MLGCSRLLYYYQFWNLFNFSFPDWQWQRKMTEKSRELEERSREFKDGKGFCKYYCIYSCKFIFTYTKNTVSLFFCGGMFCCCFCFYFIICLSVGSEVRSHLCLPIYIYATLPLSFIHVTPPFPDYKYVWFGRKKKTYFLFFLVTYLIFRCII